MSPGGAGKDKLVTFLDVGKKVFTKAGGALSKELGRQLKGGPHCHGENNFEERMISGF